jgi:hypothetical protein
VNVPGLSIFTCQFNVCCPGLSFPTTSPMYAPHDGPASVGAQARRIGGTQKPGTVISQS